MARYVFVEAGVEVGEADAGSAQEALTNFDFDASAYVEVERTIWVRVGAQNLEDADDFSTRKFRLDPREPKCSGGGEHDWRAPHRLVGGLKENPGVHAHDGGVTIQEACLRCGCGRLTDTWAMDPTDGTAGHESVEYQPGKYAEDLEPAEAG